MPLKNYYDGKICQRLLSVNDKLFKKQISYLTIEKVFRIFKKLRLLWNFLFFNIKNGCLVQKFLTITSLNNRWRSDCYVNSWPEDFWLSFHTFSFYYYVDYREIVCSLHPWSLSIKSANLSSDIIKSWSISGYYWFISCKTWED